MDMPSGGTKRDGGMRVYEGGMTVNGLLSNCRSKREMREREEETRCRHKTDRALVTQPLSPSHSFPVAKPLLVAPNSGNTICIEPNLTLHCLLIAFLPRSNCVPSLRDIRDPKRPPNRKGKKSHPLLRHHPLGLPPRRHFRCPINADNAMRQPRRVEWGPSPRRIVVS